MARTSFSLPLFSLQGIPRKLVFVVLYEAIAVAITTTALAFFSGRGVGDASWAAVLSSAIALVWNLAYNSAFEAWERRQVQKGRSGLRRVVHAAGFELGLVVMLVPLFAVLLELSLWQAFVYDLGLIAFFLVYTFAFNFVFDALLDLPASAKPAGEPPR